jgi:release factor glutamine methyltransferase
VTPDPEIVRRLRAAGCVFAEDEATMLIKAAHARAAGGSEGTAVELDAMVERRAAGEPLEQVVGYADFAGVRVGLRPGVFVPRLRSRLLVDIAAGETGPGDVVVDLCCGSGALGLAVHHRVPGISLHAADIDPTAVACAAENLGTDGTASQGDLYDALPDDLRGRIDILIANVPYVATRHLPFLPAEARDHEPATALDGGDDGLRVFRAVAERATAWLAPAGLLVSEITEAQIAAASTIAADNGLTAAIASDDDLDAYAIIARPVPAR